MNKTGLMERRRLDGSNYLELKLALMRQLEELCIGYLGLDGVATIA